MNDADISTRGTSFSYSGAWQTGTGFAKYHSDDHYSDSVGATAVLRFRGTSVTLRGALAAHHGHASVTVDGDPPIVVDEYSRIRRDDVPVYSSQSLPDSNHVVTMTVTGTRSNMSTGTVVSIDRAVLTGTSPAPPVPVLASIIYYVASSGKDTNSGLTQGSPWRSLAKVNAASLNPGDAVLFKRGDTFTGAALTVARSGTALAPITIGSYGSGNPPILDGGGTNATLGNYTPVVINGAFVTLDGIQVQHSSRDGIDVNGADAVVENSVLTHNSQGLNQRPTAARLQVAYNLFLDNNIVAIRPGNNDDSGAVAMVLQGPNPQVLHNTSSGHSGYSPDYGTDGSFCEIYGASGAIVAFNSSLDDKTFTELGASGALDNTFYDNRMVSSLSTSAGIIINGTGIYGPARGTVMESNTFYLYGIHAYGLGVEPGADLVFRNNILAVPNGNTGDTLDAIDESNNVFSGDASGIRSLRSPTQAGLAATSTLADPRLVKPTEGNLHLQLGSPAIDRGTTVPFATDYDGHPRTVGSAPDAGAFEYASS